MKDFETEIMFFDNHKYNFRNFLKKLFNCESLENIHNTHKELIPDTNTLSKPWPFNENTSSFHEVFYKKLNEPWVEIINLYDQFINEYVSNLIDGDFLYQKFPTFRICLPDLRAVTKWHFDADEEHAHPLGEINFILPITKMFDTNSIWCETGIGSNNFEPFETDINQFVKFNGNRRKHGNKFNKTKQTRFSFDFRILPMNCTPAMGLYPESFGNSAIRSQKWEAGGYYKKFTK